MYTVLYCLAIKILFYFSLFFSVIKLLQEVRNIKQEIKRTRRNSGHESEISVIDSSYVRRRRTYPRNQKILQIMRCRLARQRGYWPSYCNRLLGTRTQDGTHIITTDI
jgi:hypothetical protein